MVTINKEISHIPGLPYTNAVEYGGKRIIVIHNTATPEATADNERDYFHNNWSRIEAFVHAFADWNNKVVETAQPDTVAWGAGNVNPYAFLQIEQCISNDASKTIQSAKAVAAYVADYIKNSGKSFDDFRIMSHADVTREFGGTDHTDTIEGLSWDDFIYEIKKELELVTESPSEGVQATGGNRFQCGYAIKARADGPDTRNRQVYLFRQGDTIKYDRKLLSNGYEWISQPRSDGTFWYIPIRDLSDSATVWGSFY